MATVHYIPDSGARPFLHKPLPANPLPRDCLAEASPPPAMQPGQIFVSLSLTRAALN